MIEGGQFLAHIHNAQIHKTAACLGAVIFGGLHQLAAKPRLLTLRVYRQQAHIRSAAPRFHVNATAKNSEVVGDQEAPLLEQTAHRLQVDTILIDEEALGMAKGGVDHRYDGFRVQKFRYA
jgi:hypothetical protein